MGAEDRSESTFYVLVQQEGESEETRVDYSAEILSFEYQDEEDKADLLKLTVRNWTLNNFDNPIWKPGNTITCSWGYVGNMAPPHKVKITKVSGSTELTIEAQGGESDMNRIVRSRVWEGLTRAGVVREIAKEHGFSDEDTQWIEDTEVSEEIITQARETDAQFLRRLAGIEGYEFFIDVDGLHFHQRHVGQKPKKEVRWYLPERAGVIGGVGDIISWNVENDLFGKPQQRTGRVSVKGRDPVTKENFSVAGSVAATVRDSMGALKQVADAAAARAAATAAAVSDAGDNVVSAGETMSHAARTAASYVFGTVREDSRPTSQRDRRAAKREADGAYRKAQSNVVELSMKLIGDPQVYAKSVIAVSGISRRLAGNYYIKSARHVIGSSGYTMDLKLSSDGVGGIEKEQAERSKELEGMQNIDASKLNEQAADNADPNALTPVETVDPITGKVTIKYYDSRGWEVTPGS